MALCILPTQAQKIARPTNAKLHPHMVRLIEERGPSKAWIFFRDKGIQGATELRAALAKAESELSPRARERRLARRERPGIVDLDDVAVHWSYVDGVAATGAQVVTESSWLNAVSAHGTLSQLEAVAALPFVERIEPVRRGRIEGNPAVAATMPVAAPAPSLAASPAAGLYGTTAIQLQQLNLLRVHKRGYRGKGVVIGILDTGFHLGHEAFNQPGHVVDVIAQYDFVDDDSNPGKEIGDPAGQFHHGTWILGCIASYLPGQLVGGAYEASFILAKTEDISGEYQQEEDFYVSGLQFIESNGGDLATSSLGYIDWYVQSDLDGLTAVTSIAVNMATANGMPCMTAAGNSGHDTNPATSALIAPADSFRVITVGAVDLNGAITGFSSDGPTADGRVKPEVLGRGLFTWTVGVNADTNDLDQVSGTSLSTPLIAAGVACLLQAHPNWTVPFLRNRLFQTGDYFKTNGTFDPEHVLGYGIPDFLEAGFDTPKRRRTTEPLR